MILVGEAPASEDDAEGRPFIGKAGRLLDHCIERLGLKREDFYLTLSVRCRPSEGKLPTRKDEREESLEACQPYLFGEFQALKPKAIVALGAVALQQLTGVSEVGSWCGCKAGYWQRTPIIGSYSTAFILKQPSKERMVTQALQVACDIAGVKTTPTPGIFNYDEYD